MRHSFVGSLIVIASIGFIGKSTLVAQTAATAISNIKTAEDIDRFIASSSDAVLKKVLVENRAALAAAVALRPHLDAVRKAIEISPGKVEKINVTPESLKKAVGEIALFDTLKVVDLSMPNAGPHDHRKVDPYDAAFFEHLGQIPTLESVTIIATKLNDSWIEPLGKLTNLKALRFINNGKLSDAGLEKLAGLNQLEAFSYIGTAMKGHAYAKFEGWTKLTRCSHRGSSIDDEGLRQLCEHLPNLENISLAHAKFTDVGAVHLVKLSKLKGLEIGARNATPKCLVNLTKLPLEYLQLGDGLDATEGIAIIKAMSTLRRLTLTSSKSLTDADLAVVASMKQLEQLELNGLPLPEERLSQMHAFSFLKILQLNNRPNGYPPEIQARVKAMLPKVEVKF